MPISDVLKRPFRDPRWGAAALALAVRAAVSAQAYARNPVVSRPQLDGMYYLRWAREIAAGDVFGTGGLVGGAPLFLNPLYAYVLAPLAALGEQRTIPAVLALQALLGAGTAALAAAAAQRLFGRAAAWVAGAGVAFSAALVHLDGHLSVSGLGAFLVAGAVWSAAPRREGERPGRLGGALGPLASGLWLGIGALARPIAPLALPFYAWLHARRVPAGRRARAAAVVVVAFLLPAAASLTRNVAAGGEAVVYTAASGANVFLGNNPAARRFRAMSAAGRFRFSPFEMHEDIRRALEPRLGPDATWGERSRALSAEAFGEARGAPRAALAFLVHKARWFLSPVEPPSSASLPVDREVVPLLHLAAIPTWLLAVVGMLGLAVHGRRRDVVCGPGALVLAHVAVLTLVFPLSHYRSPAIPALAVLSGGAVAWGIAALRARRRGALAAGVAAAGALAALGALPPQPSPQRHTGMFTLASCLRDAGDLDGAERWARRGRAAFEAAWPGEPVDLLYWNVLGDVHFERDGRFDLALAEYREILDREPYDTGIRLNVVFCLMTLDRWAEALRELEELVRRAPGERENPQVLSRFAEALTRLGRADEARGYVVEALRRAGTDVRDRPRAWAIPPDLR